VLSGLRAAATDLRSAPITTVTLSRRIRGLRIALTCVWLVGLTAWIAAFGPPLRLQEVLLWLSLAMFVASVGNPLGWIKSMLIDWFPLYLLLISYNVVWGLADNMGLGPHIEPQLGFDKALFPGPGAVTWLQEHVWTGHVRLLDYAVWICYLSHFVVTLVVCAALWMRAREDFLRYRRRLVTIWFAALAVFALYPTVPPWMAAQQGHLSHVVDILSRVGQAVAPHQVSLVTSGVDGRIDLANPVAAVPSLHSALPMLLLLFFWNRTPRLRPLLVAYPLFMTFSLVYTGEHYVFDVLAGWLCAAVVHGLYVRVESRRGSPEESPSARAGQNRLLPERV
jgi:hypothetical protein